MTTLYLGLLFGSIGLGFFVYGKKQQRMVPLAVGVALSVLPYVVANPYAMIPVGLVLALLPWFLRGW